MLEVEHHALRWLRTQDSAGHGGSGYRQCGEPPRRSGPGNGRSTVFVTLCPECGERRANWGTLALVLVALILFGGVAIVVSALLR